jgi:hypothetical protein
VEISGFYAEKAQFLPGTGIMLSKMREILNLYPFFLKIALSKAQFLGAGIIYLEIIL